MFRLTREQVSALAYIVNYDIDTGNTPSIRELAIGIGESYGTADKRKQVLVERGYLINTEKEGKGKGSYKINHPYFCTTRVTARFLLAYRQLKNDGYVDEEHLLQKTTASVFSGNREHALGTLNGCLSSNLGYLLRHSDRKSQIVEGCLSDHFPYLLLIS